MPTTASAVALLALLAAPAGARVPARLVAQAEARAGLPAGLLASVVWVESRGLNLVRLHRHGCDVGPAQVHVPGCSPLAVAWLLDPRANLRAAAQVLVWSRLACSAAPGRIGCRACTWGRYNPRSPGWCAAVMDHWGCRGPAAGPAGPGPSPDRCSRRRPPDA